MTWRKKLNDFFRHNGESWDNVIAGPAIPKFLDTKWGPPNYIESEKFYIYTKQYVYSRYVTEEGYHVFRIPRNPQ